MYAVFPHHVPDVDHSDEHYFHFTTLEGLNPQECVTLRGHIHHTH